DNGNGSFTKSLGSIGINTEVELQSLISNGSSGMKCNNSSLSDKFEIKVNDVPTATIAGNTDSVCNGATGNVLITVDNVKTGEAWTVTYNVGTTTGLSKTGVGSGTFTITTPALTTGTTHTSYDVKLTNIVNTSITPSCSEALDTTITIVASPTTVGGTLSPAAAFACFDDNSGVITLTGHIGDVQHWEYSTDGGNTWTVTSNNATTLSYLNITETTSYRVWVQSSPCSGMYSSTSTITVYLQPEASITGSDKVCPNEEAVFVVTVTNVPAGNGWSLDYTENGSVKTLTGTGSGTFNLISGQYPYTTTPSTIDVTLDAISNLVTTCVNDDLNSSAQAVITPNPVADFSADNACQDSAVNFTNLSTIVEGSVASYKWYFGDNDSSLAVSPSHSYASSGTYNVTLVAVSENGCTGEVTTPVTIYDVPMADYTFDNVCKNETFTPADVSTIASGSITDWSWNFGDNTSSSLQNPTHDYAASGNYPVTLSVTSNNGCVNSTTKEVTIYVLPDADFVANPVCEDAPMIFINGSAIAYGSMTYDWSFDNQGSSTDVNPEFTFTGNGTFDVKVIATSNNGCLDSITNTVTVWPKPVAGFTVAEVCIGETSEFVNTSTITSGSVDEYFWTFGDATFSTGDNPSHTYATSNEAGYDVVLKVVSDRGCISSVNSPAIVWPLPVVNIDADEFAFCDGDSTELTVIVDQTVSSYRWSTEETTQKITVNKLGWYSVTVVGDPARGGCINSDSTFITVWENPIADAGRDSTIDKGESIVLLGSGGVSYTWTPSTYLDFDDIATPTAVEMLETQEYILTVSDENGCIDSDSVLITVIDRFKLIVYNVVTPNADGKNDTWIIDNITAYPDAQVSIINRYGMEVYNTVGYQNTWDGTYDGKDLPDGAYYYVITLPNSDADPYTGAINLIRSNN
ncbi:PKD domain-containing protein, partial [Bacteroidia bacterium]|nr:PKD domain-containing protein [Bacteroidia bacterium]